MQITDNVMSSAEVTAFRLRELFDGNGYTHYRMNKFEEYDLYARNKDFLLSENVITFTDTTGKLLALKPDVTLSIVKNHKDCPEETTKLYYHENVYRVSRRTGKYREIGQVGLECLGMVDDDCIAQVIRLAAKSLQAISEESILCVSSLDLIEVILKTLNLPDDARHRVYAAIGDKNRHEFSAVCGEHGIDADTVESLWSVMHTSGTIAQAVDSLKSRAGFFTFTPEGQRFLRILKKVSAMEEAAIIRVDLSVVSDTNYYNGIVLRGFVNGIPDAVLSGGQYDRLLRRMQRRSDAVGFAIYLDELERAAEPEKSADEMLNIALPKGRLGEKVYTLFEKAGYECPELLDPKRKLIFENTEKKVRYFWVKPSDVAIYVERGAADIGVAGKDILLETEMDLYELLDLGVGKCRMAVAGPEGFTDAGRGTLRVATKFPNIASNYYIAKGRDIDIIKLNGSIEIAPILGLSDVIVDIVETGTTLRENHLAVLDTVVPISARLIANKVSAQFKRERIAELTAKLSECTEDEA